MMSDTLLNQKGENLSIDEIERILKKGPEYRPAPIENDTIFNRQDRAEMVILANRIFGAYVQKIEYDDFGRISSVKGYDEKGDIRPFAKDIAIRKYTYNVGGNIIEISNLDKGGNFISGDFEDSPMVRRIYDEQNRMIEEWFLNSKGELRTEYSIAKLTYDDQGNQVFVGWFNEKGEKEP